MSSGPLSSFTNLPENAIFRASLPWEPAPRPDCSAEAYGLPAWLPVPDAPQVLAALPVRDANTTEPMQQVGPEPRLSPGGRSFPTGLLVASQAALRRWIPP